MLSVLRYSLFGLLFAVASVRAEPSIDQIYQAAHSGNVAVAQSMMDEVLKAHPQSAKAHFVQAELYARTGKIEAARASLAKAEELKPGLAFAKPEAVAALRRALGGAPAANAAPAGAEQGPLAGSNGIKTFLFLAGGVVLVVWIVRRMTARPAYGPADGGAYGPGAAPGYGPGYGPGGGPGGGPGYGPGYGSGYGPGAGAGGGIMRGLATGAAVGAGIVAGEALAHRLVDGGDHGRDLPVGDDPRNRTVDVSAPDDMGGQDFGIADSGSWDDDSGGGSSWD